MPGIGAPFDEGNKRQAGRPPGSLNKSKLKLAEQLEELGCDPIKLTALYAMGDVVALGMMTQDELDAEAEVIHSERSVIRVPSGHELAMESLPASVRQKAAETLLDRLHPKLKSVEHTGEIKTTPTLEIILSALPADAT